MPKRSSKHVTLDRRMVVPTQGMNLAVPANAIGDNELSRAYNWWYEPERGLCVRQGLAREDVAALASPIVALHPYVSADGTLRLLAASGGKLYEKAPFSRASTATYFGGEGLLKTAGIDEPRIEYDPVTGASKGLLIEASRANLLTYSNITDANWVDSGNGRVSDIGTTAPDGTTSAKVESVATVSGVSRIIQPGTTTLTAGTKYTYSAYIKKGNIRFAYMLVIGSVFTVPPTVFVDLDSGIIVSTTSSVESASILPTGNGWYRISMTTVAAESTTTSQVYIGMSKSSGAQTHGATAGDHMYIWGAQLEAGSSPTSYIPTTTTAITRAADIPSHWDQVSTTVSTSSHVSMITFNGTAIIADGTATNGLLKYDGSTTSYISGSPAKPLCLMSHANRVVCASASTPDYVYFSGPNDLADWATASPGAALTIAAGFGDGYSITGLATIYDALIVSKVKRDTDGNIVGRKVYAIFTQGAPENWQVKLISSENAAMLCGGLCAVGEMVYMVDINGFKAVSPTPNGQYGDVSVDPVIGVRINKLVAQFARNADKVMMEYVPSLAQVWCVVGSSSQARVFCWHPIQGAFTQIDFGAFIPRAVAQIGQLVYLAGNDGVLYRLTNAGQDELADDTFTDIYATLRTRVFEGLGGDLILKKTKVVIEPLRPANVKVEAYLPVDNRRVEVGDIETGSGSASVPLYEAFDLLADADYSLSDSTTNYDTTFYSGPRASSMCLQIRTLGGRVVLNSITAEFAVVGR